MSFIFDLVKAFGFGTILFIVAPLFAALLPWEYAKRVTGVYQSLAMSVLGRAIMLQRSHGGLALKKSSYDAGLHAEKVNLGEEQYFRDPKGLMGTFKGHVFGLAHEDRATILDAQTAFFGRRFAELVADDRFEQNGMFKAFFSVPQGKRILVDLADAKAIIQGSAPPSGPERIDTFAEQGQSLYNSDNTAITVMTMLGFLLAGFGLMFMAKEAGGAAGDAVSSIPIYIGVLPF